VRTAASNTACIRQGFQPPGPFVPGVLRAVARGEAALWRRPPMGSSLLLAARSRLPSAPAGA